MLKNKSWLHIDAFRLKMIMAVLMLMDHLYYFLPGFPIWFHGISRIVAPIFTFFVAQGMVYTRDRLAYLKRLYFVGGIMLIMSLVLYAIFGSTPPNSIIISLALTATIIFSIDKARERGGVRRFGWIMAAIVFFGLCMAFEGAMLCPVMGCVFYYLRGDKLQMCAIYIVTSVIMLWVLGLFYDIQMLMLLAVIPIYLYNGERGNSSKFAKYFFYFFYPVHIWVIFLIQQLFFK